MVLKKTMEKAHVITDFIRKGFETGVIDMMTDGTEAKGVSYMQKTAAKRWKPSWGTMILNSTSDE